MRFRREIDDKWLMEEYKKRSAASIAKELGISPCTVGRRLKYLGVSPISKAARAEEKYCSVKGCNSKAKAKGLCVPHYAKLRQRLNHYEWRKKNDTKQNAYQREWYRKNPDKKKIQYNNLKERQRKVKQEFMEMLGGSCVVCGYNKCLRAMVFHHNDPFKKKFSISGGFLSTKRLYDTCVEELKKCTLLCNRCHEEFHEGLITL